MPLSHFICPNCPHIPPLQKFPAAHCAKQAGAHCVPRKVLNFSRRPVDPPLFAASTIANSPSRRPATKYRRHGYVKEMISACRMRVGEESWLCFSFPFLNASFPRAIVKYRCWERMQGETREKKVDTRILRVRRLLSRRQTARGIELPLLSMPWTYRLIVLCFPTL